MPWMRSGSAMQSPTRMRGVQGGGRILEDDLQTARRPSRRCALRLWPARSRPSISTRPAGGALRCPITRVAGRRLCPSRTRPRERGVRGRSAKGRSSPRRRPFTTSPGATEQAPCGRGSALRRSYDEDGGGLGGGRRRHAAILPDAVGMPAGAARWPGRAHRVERSAPACRQRLRGEAGNAARSGIPRASARCPAPSRRSPASRASAARSGAEFVRIQERRVGMARRGEERRRTAPASTTRRHTSRRCGFRGLGDAAHVRG